jgi:predicted kinase
MGQEVIILRGLPASGKTTWSLNYISEHPEYIRINKDEIRKIIHHDVYSKENEKITLHIRDILINSCLNKGESIIIDDTNLNPFHEQCIRQLVKQYNKENNTNIAISIVDFPVSVEECIQRDGDRMCSVGKYVIEKMSKRWDYPQKLSHQIPEIDVETFLKDKRTPCIIYDLDGTAAITGDRCIYDASNCDKIDRCNNPLQTILQMVKTYYDINDAPIVFIALSGRKEEYRAPTIRFLDQYSFPYHKLYMRNNDDNRKDSVIKKEIFEKHIAPHYKTLVVFDDRNQVVDMWRNELHIPCFQVNYGDF